MAVSGGDKLDAHLKGIIARIGRGQQVRVGFLEGSTYPDGTSTPMVAAANEFGDPARGRPPRPFFRLMVDANAPGWGAKVGKVLAATGFDGERTLQFMGEQMRGELQDSIRKFTAPELAPSTIARKGFDKPLIDTAHMINSVGYDLRDGE